MKRRVLYLLVALLAIGFGADLVSMSVKNETDVYIHVRVGDVWLLDIPPGATTPTVQVPEGPTVCFVCSVPATDPALRFSRTDTIDVAGPAAQFTCDYLDADMTWTVNR